MKERKGPSVNVEAAHSLAFHMLTHGLDDIEVAHESGHMLIDTLAQFGFVVVRAAPAMEADWPGTHEPMPEQLPQNARLN